MCKRLLCLLLSVLFAVIVMCSTVSAYQPYTAVYDFGDVNNDGSVTANDALLTLQCSVNKLALNYDEQDAADVDENWQITASDALLILQDSVKKITLTKSTNPYDAYELKYVEPTGLTEYKMYRMLASTCFKDLNTYKNYDLTRLAVDIQGLINRNNDIHHVAVALTMDPTDIFWYDYISEDGATYDNYETVEIESSTDFIETFLPFIKACGIILWDPSVPATANVAETICGLYNYLPVQYCTDDGSLYKRLTEDYNVPVKMNLVGKFNNAKTGSKIPDTLIDSTGSAKNDAYLWAMDKYMSECNPEILAYTLDGAGVVKSNPVYTLPNGGSAQVNGIPNHDYFISKQCFFFDLTAYAYEAPSDDTAQALGTDAATMRKILQKRYDMANGNFGEVIGFPPWHLKYTSTSGGNTIDGARLEWLFVETCVSFNCGIEADAPHPCWMSNGSLYTKYQRRFEIKGNAEAKDIEYDPDTYYYSFGFDGDYDCSPWLKNNIPSVWGEDNRGTTAFTYNINPNLIDRVPMAFDYIYQNKTINDYISPAEGMGYVMTAPLFKGFVGKEASSGTRTLPSGDRAYIHYAKPYFEMLKHDFFGRMINGFSVVEPQELALMQYLAPNGGILQDSAAGSINLRVYNGTPYIRDGFVSNPTADDAAIQLRAKIKSQKNNFYLFGGISNRSSLEAFLKTFNEYVVWHDPGVNYQYVDIETFFSLISQSNQGTVIE